MLDFICTFVLLYIVISIIWPRLGSSPVANDRKHREVLRPLRSWNARSCLPLILPRCLRSTALSVRAFLRWGGYVTVQSVIPFWTRLG